MSNHQMLYHPPNPRDVRRSTSLEVWTVKLGCRNKDYHYFAQIGSSVWSVPGNQFKDLGEYIAKSDQTYARQFNVVGGTIMVRQNKGHLVPMKGVTPEHDVETLEALSQVIKYNQSILRAEMDYQKRN